MDAAIDQMVPYGLTKDQVRSTVNEFSCKSKVPATEYIVIVRRLLRNPCYLSNHNHMNIAPNSSCRQVRTKNGLDMGKVPVVYIFAAFIPAVMIADIALWINWTPSCKWRTSIISHAHKEPCCSQETVDQKEDGKECQGMHKATR
ncbi:hypothetical protein LOK49_LG06G02459 [Camellia lanceoleosa]|uniref:Uncharacterized protein n=1 Tax=Camellia lanceoleosa TaxID=1840588 RepID=A0ACC0HAD5_9ERIC|nr:hypothetical protein LOK49_LG06G02459 [Camellia lanceoleosa]